MCFMPDTALSTLYKLMHLIFITCYHLVNVIIPALQMGKLEHSGVDVTCLG